MWESNLYAKYLIIRLLKFYVDYFCKKVVDSGRKWENWFYFYTFKPIKRVQDIIHRRICS